MSAVREEFERLLDRLDEQQVQTALDVLKNLYPEVEQQKPAYDEANDPFIKGLFDGETDLSEHTQDSARAYLNQKYASQDTE